MLAFKQMILWHLAVKLYTKRSDMFWIQQQDWLHDNLLPIRYYNLLWKKFWKGSQLRNTPSYSPHTVYNISQTIMISGPEVNSFSETTSLNKKIPKLCRNMWYTKLCMCIRIYIYTHILYFLLIINKSQKIKPFHFWFTYLEQYILM